MSSILNWLASSKNSPNGFGFLTPSYAREILDLVTSDSDIRKSIQFGASVDEMKKSIDMGAISGDQSADLMKALMAGYDVGGTTQANFAALRIENLQDFMAILTAQERHIALLKHPKLAQPHIRTTAYEYVRQTAIGNTDYQWRSEGELGDEEEGTEDRRVALCKYQSIVGSYSLVATLVNAMVSPEVLSTRQRLLSMRITKERSLFMGNARLGLNGVEGMEPDGIETIVTRDVGAANIVNCWGQPMTNLHLDNAVEIIRSPGFGFASDVLIPHVIWKDFSAEFMPNFQWRPGDVGKNNEMNVGMMVRSVPTTTGELDFTPIHLYQGLTMETPLAASMTRAPTPAPAVTIASVATGTGQWANALGAAGGTVEYRASLCNRYGESTAPVTVPASLAIGAGAVTNSARITVTNPAAGYNAPVPNYVKIYARYTNALGVVSAWGCISRSPITTLVGGAASLVYDDNGTSMPGTYRAFVLDFQPTTYQAPQLMETSKIELPMLTLSKQAAYANFWWGMSEAPLRIVMISNIGRRTS